MLAIGSVYNMLWLHYLKEGAFLLLQSVSHGFLTPPPPPVPEGEKLVKVMIHHVKKNLNRLSFHVVVRNVMINSNNHVSQLILDKILWIIAFIDIILTNQKLQVLASRLLWRCTHISDMRGRN